MTGLDDTVQAAFDARLLQWARDDKWLDVYGGPVVLDEPGERYGERFEELTKMRDIHVTKGRILYRILGVHFSIWEFVMLIGYSDSKRRSKTPADVQRYYLERLDDLRRNRHHRRDYGLELE